MNKVKKIPLVQSALIVLLVLGLIALYFIDRSIRDQELHQRQVRLHSVHEKAIAHVTDAIDNFATLVSGIRSHMEHSDSLPSAAELQDFVNDLVKDINYQDSIIVSFIDTTHTFKYSFTRSSLDPAGLVGTSLAAIRDDIYLEEVDRAIAQQKLRLHGPINLKEGWVGASLNFGIMRDGKRVGYVAPLINFKTVLDRIYRTEDAKNYVFRFTTEKGFDFDRERVYNNTKVYNPKQDPEYYKNFEVKPEAFINSSFDIHGLTLKLGAAYKAPYKRNVYLSYLLYGWYTMLMALAALIIGQVKLISKVNSQIDNDLKEAQKLTQLGSFTRNLVTGKRTWSDEFYRIYGLQPGDRRLNEDTEMSFIHPLDRKYVHQLIRKTIQEGTDCVCETRIVRANKEIGMVRLKARVITSDKGRPVAMIGTVHDITDQKKMEAELIDAIHTGQEKERHRLAQEMHDGLGQHLALTKIMLSNIERNVNQWDPKNREQFGKAIDLLNDAIVETRQISHDLIPFILESRGFEAALAHICENVRKSNSIEVNFSGTGLENQRLDPNIELGLYRILQELVSNVLKHAKASKIDVLWEKLGPTFFLKVADNGIGLSTDFHSKGIGVRNIEARVQGLQGKFILESAPQKGTTVIIEIPC